jgi:hypothetical protein
MFSFVFNLIFTTASSDETTLKLIVGSPLVPAIFLAIAVKFCPESPRYYMMPNSPRYNSQKAYLVLRNVRNTEVCFTIELLSIAPDRILRRRRPG